MMATGSVHVLSAASAAITRGGARRLIGRANINGYRYYSDSSLSNRATCRWLSSTAAAPTHQPLPLQQQQQPTPSNGSVVVPNPPVASSGTIYKRLGDKRNGPVCKGWHAAVVAGLFTNKLQIEAAKGQLVTIVSANCSSTTTTTTTKRMEQQGKVSKPHGSTGKCKVVFPHGLTADVGQVAHLHHELYAEKKRDEEDLTKAAPVEKEQARLDH